MVNPRESLPRGARRVAVLCALVLATGASAAHAYDLWQLSSHALGGFKFEGVALGSTAADLKRHLPLAHFAYDSADAQAGVTIYKVDGTKTADGATFYFLHDALYQVDMEYKLARVEELGGPDALVGSLIRSLGPPDYADFFRRTWHQPNCRRRADFYATDHGARLVITDTSRVLTADRRLHDNEPTQVLTFGIEQ